MVLADSRRPSRNRRYSGALTGGQYVSCTGPLPSAAGLSRAVPLHTDFVTPRPIWCSVSEVPQPRTGNATRLFHQFGLGSSRFARRYSGNRFFFLFLRVLRCFSSPGSLRHAYVFSMGCARFTHAGFPIRKSTGINACTRLPEAYRSVLRPSSALDAKASTICP